jgi:1-acyl-sn-glycerol-3-phosphate acyltransferase
MRAFPTDAMRSLIFNLFFYGFTLVMAVVCYIVARTSTRDRLWRAVGFWGRTLVGAVRLILDARIELRGLENLPRGGPKLVVCKHQSELDIILLASAVPQFGAVAMQELERYPFFGPILHKLDLVLVPVNGAPQGRTGKVIEGALRVNGDGRPMFIFPEATLMSLGAKERYRQGLPARAVCLRRIQPQGVQRSGLVQEFVQRRAIDVGVVNPLQDRLAQLARPRARNRLDNGAHSRPCGPIFRLHVPPDAALETLAQLRHAVALPGPVPGQRAQALGTDHRARR